MFWKLKLVIVIIWGKCQLMTNYDCTKKWKMVSHWKKKNISLSSVAVPLEENKKLKDNFSDQQKSQNIIIGRRIQYVVGSFKWSRSRAPFWLDQCRSQYIYIYKIFWIRLTLILTYILYFYFYLIKYLQWNYAADLKKKKKGYTHVWFSINI